METTLDTTMESLLLSLLELFVVLTINRIILAIIATVAPVGNFFGAFTATEYSGWAPFQLVLFKYSVAKEITETLTGRGIICKHALTEHVFLFSISFFS